MSRARCIRIVFTLSVAVMVLGVAAALLSVVAPYDVIKSLIDSLAADGSAEFLTPTFYSSVGSRFRVLGISLLVFGGLGTLFRNYIGESIEHLDRTRAKDTRDLIRDALSVRHHGVHFYGLCGLLVIALLVRVHFLNQPMRPDESYTFLRYVPLPPYLLIADYDLALPNNHILHTLLVKLSCAIFGDAPWAIRLPALVAGLLIVPATYGVGYMLYGKNTGLLAAGLTTAASVLVEYSTNARGYGLVTLAFLVGVILAVYLVTHLNRVCWVLLIVVSALGFYAMPLMVFPFGIVITWLLLSALGQKSRGEKIELGRKTILCGALVVVCTVALYTPVMLSLVEREHGLGEFGPSSWRFSWEPLRATWDSWNRSVPLPLTYLLAAGALLGIAFHRRKSAHRSFFIAAVLWCSALVFLRGVIPPSRQSQSLLPIYSVLAASGLVFLYESQGFLRERKRLFVAGVLVLSAALSMNLIQTQTPTIDRTPVGHAEDLTKYLAEQLLPGQHVVVVGPSFSPMSYYFLQMGIRPDFLVKEDTSDAWMSHGSDLYLYVVVYKGAADGHRLNATLETADEKVGLSVAWDMSSAKLDREYDSALLYTLKPWSD